MEGGKISAAAREEAQAAARKRSDEIVLNLKYDTGGLPDRAVPVPGWVWREPMPLFASGLFLSRSGGKRTWLVRG